MPIKLEFESNGRLIEARWAVPTNNDQHDYPHVVNYSNEYYVNRLSWCVLLDDSYDLIGAHRINKPATIVYNEKSQVIREIYSEYNKIHRVNGPAVIHYENEQVIEEIFVLFDKEMTKEKWLSSDLVQEYYRDLKNKSNGTITTNVSF